MYENNDIVRIDVKERVKNLQNKKLNQIGKK